MTYCVVVMTWIISQNLIIGREALELLILTFWFLMILIWSVIQWLMIIMMWYSNLLRFPVFWIDWGNINKQMKDILYQIWSLKVLCFALLSCMSACLVFRQQHIATWEISDVIWNAFMYLKSIFIIILK